MYDFTSIMLIIGRKEEGSDKIMMLGSGFFVSNDGKIVTARHVVGNLQKDLFVILPNIPNINTYQDVADLNCQCLSVTIEDVNPITDLCILKIVGTFSSPFPVLGSLDSVIVGQRVGIFGYPHCVHGRRVLTYQETEIGAKMLLETSCIKSKYATINIQTRPGQSGSIIFDIHSGTILGLLIGSYAPPSGISIAGINPYELNQTSYCISANHIKEML